MISPTESQHPHKPAGKRPAGVGAATLIRRPKLWLIPAALASLVALLLSLLYMGGILDPNGDLHHLPIALVDADSGAGLRLRDDALLRPQGPEAAHSAAGGGAAKPMTGG